MRRLALVGLLAIACRHDAEHAEPHDSACAKATPHSGSGGALAWFVDDYPSALACAREKHVPIVLDLWAPWCHTCLSMQTTVFVDPSFGKDAGRFVFASLDTDRPSNAPPLAKLSISAWPTFYVLGSDETVLARWVGAASVEQFHQFLDAGARATAGGQAASDAHLLSAERALAVKDLDNAVQELTAALAAGPPDWPRRADVLGSLILTQQKRKDYDACVAVAERHMGDTGDTAAASDFLATAMTCADSLGKTQADRAKALREQAVMRWQGLLAVPKSSMSIDDRSDALLDLRETLDELGRKDDAHAVAETQRAMLDDAANKAPTPVAAMTYNWHRAEVYVYLGRGLDLIPALEKSVKDLPGEYDPPARIGWVYWKTGKLDEAARWTDRALALAYGPRKARLFTQRAEIAKLAGDTAAEKKARLDAVALLESLPDSQKRPEDIDKAKAQLAAVGAGSGSGSAAGSGSAVGSASSKPAAAAK